MPGPLSIAICELPPSIRANISLLEDLSDSGVFAGRILREENNSGRILLVPPSVPVYPLIDIVRQYRANRLHETGDTTQHGGPLPTIPAPGSSLPLCPMSLILSVCSSVVTVLRRFHCMGAEHGSINPFSIFLTAEGVVLLAPPVPLSPPAPSSDPTAAERFMPLFTRCPHYQTAMEALTHTRSVGTRLMRTIIPSDSQISSSPIEVGAVDRFGLGATLLLMYYGSEYWTLSGREFSLTNCASVLYPSITGRWLGLPADTVFCDGKTADGRQLAPPCTSVSDVVPEATNLMALPVGFITLSRQVEALAGEKSRIVDS